MRAIGPVLSKGVMEFALHLTLVQSRGLALVLLLVV